jgi:hypothetical protein
VASRRGNFSKLYTRPHPVRPVPPSVNVAERIPQTAPSPSPSPVLFVGPINHGAVLCVGLHTREGSVLGLLSFMYLRVVTGWAPCSFDVPVCLQAIGKWQQRSLINLLNK